MIITIAAAFLGAFHRIALGGALRKWIAVTLGFIVYGFIIAACTGDWIAAVVVSAFTQAMWALGHGDGIDMGTEPQQGDDWLRPVIDWLFGPTVTPGTDRAFWRDFCHMSIRYGIQTGAMSFALVLFGHEPAALFAPVGLLGGACYALTRTPLQRWFPSINVGEPAIGAVIAGGLALVLA